MFEPLQSDSHYLKLLGTYFKIEFFNVTSANKFVKGVSPVLRCPDTSGRVSAIFFTFRVLLLQIKAPSERVSTL